MAALIQELNVFTAWLSLTSIKSAFLIILILLIQHGLQKYLSAKARHRLWLSLLICLSIPVGWNLSLDQTLLLKPTITQDEISTSSPQTPNFIDAAKQNSASYIDTSITRSSPSADKSITGSIHLHSVLSIIWLTGFVFFILVTVWQAKRFNLILRKATKTTSKQQSQLENYKKLLNTNQNINLVYSNHITSPLTLGLLQPTIILPMDIERQLTPQELKLVLLHELTHIQRKDILWNWITHGITLLHWFNPLIWITNRRIRADMEMACDEALLTKLAAQDRHDYGMTLIKVSQFVSRPQAFPNSLGILENHRELKNRLIMIKEYTTMNLKKTIVFGLALSALTFTALAQPEKSATEKDSRISTDTSISLQQFANKAEQDLKTKILIGIKSDSRIQANIGNAPISYEQLLTQLQINGYTAFKTKDYIQILSVRDARTMAPIVEKGKTYYADEFVTDYIKLEKACAESVLAVVRPLVPSYGFLSTYVDAKTLIIVDAYSNVQRVKQVVTSIEQNISSPKECPENSLATNNKK